MAREVKSNRFLHEAVGKFLKCGRHNMYINLISSLFNSLDCALKLFGKVELGNYVDSFHLCNWINHTTTQRGGESHRNARCLLEARLKHINHSLFFTAIDKIITVFKEEIGRLEVVFDETLQ